MKALLCIVGSFFLITAVDHVLGQTPSPTCVTDFRFQPDRQYPQDWHVIVDSYSYDDLFRSSSAVWKRRDVDGTGNQWDSRGGQCRYEISACTFKTPNQNNWFFTDFNSYDEAKEVIVNVTFQWSQCTQGPACRNDYATVYRYDTNGSVTTSQQTNPNNYVLLSGDLDGSRFQQNRSNRLTEINLKLLPFTRPPDSKGLYLGFRDEGTCGHIIRFIVYYKIAPEIIDGLLTCPEVPLVSGSSSSVTCSCADNASPPAGDLDRTCNDDGECSDPPTCECAPGYEFMSDDQSCRPCNMGMYKFGISNTETCRPCPTNSEAPEQASTKCMCLANFIRNESNPHDNCTQPPSSPRPTPRAPTDVPSDTTTTIRIIIIVFCIAGTIGVVAGLILGICCGVYYYKKKQDQSHSNQAVYDEVEDPKPFELDKYKVPDEIMHEERR